MNKTLYKFPYLPDIITEVNVVKFTELVKHQLVTLKSRQLIKFIRKEFPVKGDNYSDYMEKYEALKQLTSNDFSAGIARMTRIETSYDNSKNAALLVLIFNLIIGVLKVVISAGIELNNITDKVAQGLNVAYGLFIIIFAGIFFVGLWIDKNKVTTATYFKTLLEQAKSDKENKKDSLSPTKTRSYNQIEVKILKVWPFWKKNNFYIKQAKSLEEVLLQWSNEEVASYISDCLGYWSSKDKKAELQRIRGLDLDTIILAIARMKDIEEHSDNSKVVPGLTSVSTFFVTQLVYYFAYENDGKPTMASVTIGFMFSVGIFYGITYGMDSGRTRRARAVQYRSLLEQVKSEIEKYQ